jgi:hypothetical protein
MEIEQVSPRARQALDSVGDNAAVYFIGAGGNREDPTTEVVPSPWVHRRASVEIVEQLRAQDVLAA